MSPPTPPAPAVLAALTEQDLADLRLYSDPEGTALQAKLAGPTGWRRAGLPLQRVGRYFKLRFHGLRGRRGGVPRPDLQLYPVFANLHGVAYETVPLREDFTLDVAGMQGKGKLTVFPNPNAPTGIALPLDQVEAIVAANPDHVVVVDEAYVDFGADSAVPLLQKYDNLLVVMTYSKSRSMAGARLGFALGSRGLIEDLEKLKYSTNPYNVNRLTLKLGAAAVASDGYFREKAREIMATRERTAQALRALGFTLPDSQANFLFVTHPKVAGGRPCTASARRRGS